MDFDDFGSWDADYREEAHQEDANSVDSLDNEALEAWLSNNHSLWKLGLALAKQARQFRREYAHVPFNQNGWFSPN